MDNIDKKEEIKAVIQQAVVAFNHWNQMTTLEKIYFPEREPLLFKEHARVMDQFFAHFTPASALELLDELEKAQRQIVNFQQSCENDPRIHEIIDLKELIAELDKRLIEYAGIATREARRVAELEKYRTAFMEWHDKTAWVQSDKRFDVVRPLGKHRADVLREYIEHLEARQIALPQRLSPEGYHIDEAYMVDDAEGEYLDRDAVIEAISGAGIKVIEGEGQ
ncbi:ead/Ea22-like family protein [Salmonella enterica subsp. enterica serovar Agbeni]|nr:ead/Ea22-like family protein [Salmonella enterica subsp. enterica serovar Agbeni]EIW3217388.1 ead/Ea22-like family protein [Salmonella enterica subsp. enterica serovar Agbeni]